LNCSYKVPPNGILMNSCFYNKVGARDEPDAVILLQFYVHFC
jgi:hypothetical protein